MTRKHAAPEARGRRDTRESTRFFFLVNMNRCKKEIQDNAYERRPQYDLMSFSPPHLLSFFLFDFCFSFSPAMHLTLLACVGCACRVQYADMALHRLKSFAAFCDVMACSL